MKVTFDIDCTPEEARRFFGLPDLTPLHDAVLTELQNQALTNLKKMAPEELVKLWFPGQWQDAMPDWQRFWQSFMKGQK